jgi:hypothetical protein
MDWQSMLVDLAGFESGGMAAYPAVMGILMILVDHLLIVSGTHEISQCAIRAQETYQRVAGQIVTRASIFRPQAKVPVAPKCAKFF